MVGQPAKPVWLHESVVAALGERWEVGFTDIKFVSLVGSLSNLKLLWLHNTRVTDTGLQKLMEQLPGSQILHSTCIN